MGTIDELFVDIDQLMDQLFRRLDPLQPAYSTWQPKVDVYELPDRIVVIAELGGVRREDLRLSMLGNELVIAGIRHSPSPDKTISVHQLEIECGRFMRRLRLSRPVARRHMHATFVDGILTINILRG